MTGPLGNSEFYFPRISMLPSTSSRETLRFSGNKFHCSPRDQSLSVKYILKQWIVLNAALIGSSNSEYPELFTSEQLGKNGVPICIREK